MANCVTVLASVTSAQAMWRSLWSGGKLSENALEFFYYEEYGMTSKHSLECCLLGQKLTVFRTIEKSVFP